MLLQCQKSFKFLTHFWFYRAQHNRLEWKHLDFWYHEYPQSLHGFLPLSSHCGLPER